MKRMVAVDACSSVLSTVNPRSTASLSDGYSILGQLHRFEMLS